MDSQILTLRFTKGYSYNYKIAEVHTFIKMSRVCANVSLLYTAFSIADFSIFKKVPFIITRDLFGIDKGWYPY